MIEYFINFYIGPSRNYFTDYLKDKYGKDAYNFKKFITDRKRRGWDIFCNEELEHIIYYSKFFNILDEKTFYSNENIKSFYKVFDENYEDSHSGDYAWEFLDDAFEELKILYNFKEFNDFLDKKYNDFLKEINSDEKNNEKDNEDVDNEDKKYNRKNLYKMKNNKMINNNK